MYSRTCRGRWRRAVDLRAFAVTALGYAPCERRKSPLMACLRSWHTSARRDEGQRNDLPHRFRGTGGVGRAPVMDSRERVPGTQALRRCCTPGRQPVHRAASKNVAVFPLGRRGVPKLMSDFFTLAASAGKRWSLKPLFAKHHASAGTKYALNARRAALMVFLAKA